jgi:hypothetical protein
MVDAVPVPGEGASETELPDSAWGAGWAFLAVEAVALLRRGFTGVTMPWPLVSMVLSALVVGWFTAGVLQARPIRTFLVWLILIVATLLQVISLLSGPRGLGSWFEFLVGLIPVVVLAAFCRSPFYAHMRLVGADAVRPAIGGVVALAVITGALGGIVAPVSGDGDQIHVGL